MAKNGGGGMANMRTVLSWVLGVATIALTLLIMLILFGNLSDNLGFGNDAITVTIVNESVYANPPYVNSTGYVLSGFNSTWSAITLTNIFNATDHGAPGGTDYNFTITLANATVSSLGVVLNASNVEYQNVSLSYTYSHSFPSANLALSNSFIGNYTLGVANTGSQFPVVGTIIGIALLLLILIGILVFAMVSLARMNVGGSSSGSFG